LTPSASTHRGKECGGVQLIVDDWARFRPLRLGLALAAVLRRLYPDEWTVDRYDRLLGHKATGGGGKAGRPWRGLGAGWQDGLKEFLTVRSRSLLYTD